MKRHINPYLIRDPNNIFEVIENSSHPELMDVKRIIRFKAYTFQNVTELSKFFESEGLDPSKYWIKPQSQKDLAGKVTIIVDIIDRKAPGSRRMDSLYAS